MPIYTHDLYDKLDIVFISENISVYYAISWKFTPLLNLHVRGVSWYFVNSHISHTLQQISWWAAARKIVGKPLRPPPAAASYP